MGILGWAALVLVVAAAAAVVYLFYRKRKAQDAVPHERAEPGGRVSILESTPVDETRKLVLIRCDNVEHLMMIGGPADVVVENDVRKVRSGSALTTPAIAPSPSLSPAPSVAPALTARAAEPLKSAADDRTNGAARRLAAEAPKIEAPKVEAPAPASNLPKTVAAGDLQAPIVRPADPAPASVRPALAAVPSGKNGAASPSPAATAVQPAASSGQGAARDTAAGASRNSPATAPAAKAQAAKAQNDRRRRELAARSGEAGKPVGLPAAQTPWPEGESIENEIVRALRSDVETSTAPAKASAQQEPAAKTVKDPSTTLGDLAERLEEALAREVQQSNKGRGRLDLGLDAYVMRLQAHACPVPRAAARVWWARRRSRRTHDRFRSRA